MVVRMTRQLSWEAFRLMCRGGLIGGARDPAAGVMEGIQDDVQGGGGLIGAWCA